MPDIEEYKKYVGYVMSYSFTDEKTGVLGKTMLVPFVDIINHSSYNNVELTFHPKCLKLMAVKDIHKVKFKVYVTCMLCVWWWCLCVCVCVCVCV